MVDTSAFYALANSADAHHLEAREILARAVRQRWMMVTNNYLVAETHALLLNRSGREPAMRFLQGLEESAVAIERAEADDERAARAIIYRYEDKAFSLTDAISFTMMERLGITVAFTFDRNFAQYGFELARA